LPRVWPGLAAPLDPCWSEVGSFLHMHVGRREWGWQGRQAQF
jgi:hypothetical protein